MDKQPKTHTRNPFASALATLQKPHIRAKDREFFTSNLALLLQASVPIGEVLSSLRETSRSKALNKILEQMGKDIDNGMPLWQALEHSGIMSPETLALVRLGEQSGNLAENLQVAARQEEKQRAFRSKVRSALMYPSFVMGVTALIGLGVSWFLLPKLSVTFSQMHIKLPLISRIVIGFGTILKTQGFWLLPAFAAGVAGVIYVLFIGPRTKILGQRMLLRAPGIGKLLHEVEIARFGYLLGTLLKAGLSITEALDLLEAAAGVESYKKFYHYLHESLGDGYSIRSSFPRYPGKADRLIPPTVQQMIIAGEHSGALPETLTRVGALYEEKADLSTQNLETALEPILLLIVWVGVLSVAVAVILPIYSLVGGLSP